MNKEYELSFWESRQIHPPSIYDNLIKKSIEEAGGQYDNLGHYKTMVLSGIKTEQDALDIKRKLRKAAFEHFVSVRVEVKKNWLSSSYELYYAVVNKQHARRHIKRKFGKVREPRK